MAGFKKYAPWLYAGFFVLGLAFLPPFVDSDLTGEVLSAKTTGYASQPLTRSVASLAAGAQVEDLSCNCEVRGETFAELAFETPEECGPDRNYLEPGLARLKALDQLKVFGYTRDLNQTNAIIPRKCFLFAMKHTFPTSFKSQIFGVCGKKPTAADPSDFTRTGFKPCVTEDLTNVVYNAYLDASDCFDVPVKFSLAKFMNESGVIPNIVASNNDSGLSQFSTSALGILKRDYAKWSKKIVGSTKPACLRLMSMTGAMPMSPNDVVAEDQKKCHMIEVPPNPVRNFIYYGAFYHVIRNDALASFNKSQEIDKETGLPDPNYKGVDQLMAELKIADFDKNLIFEAIEIMSYNTGPKAAIYFREWLRYRIAKHPTVQVTKADLSMEILPDPWSPFSSSITDQQLLDKYDQGGKRAMKFWEWLGVAKKRFAYASYVKFYANRLDKNLGEGVCTQSPFLELEK